ncbi:MAG: tRNA pseudouridine(55) synthase TruB [Candidatus Cloacimonetes bacterium]|nr:tRNA pseudouridine(55) synthase TruB [Candidatus Cloacimonadota bacterium]
MTERPIVSAGFLLVNKPVGCTSFDVIRHLKRVTGLKRLGHTGTLDPFASGLMICCLGSYTRLASLLESHNKTYTATLKLGEKTDSGDLTGKVVAWDRSVPDIQDVHAIRDLVTRITKLPVPAYSAVKIDGKRAYKYARQNIDVTTPIKPTRIYEYELLSYQYPFLVYRCRVSKGTYIRSLSEWIAVRLGTVGHTIQLERMAVDSIDVTEASPPTEITEVNWMEKLVDPIPLFSGQKIIKLSDNQIEALHKGRSVPTEDTGNDLVLITDQHDQIRTLGYLADGSIKPKVNLT